jgi:hypothetical protein
VLAAGDEWVAGLMQSRRHSTEDAECTKTKAKIVRSAEDFTPPRAAAKGTTTNHTNYTNRKERTETQRMLRTLRFLLCLVPAFSAMQSINFFSTPCKFFDPQISQTLTVPVENLWKSAKSVDEFDFA